MNIEELNLLIAQRRSVYPKNFIDKPIPKDIIMQLLSNANWAPNHKRTEPWRFKVITNSSKVKLGQFLAEFYKKNTPTDKFLEAKYLKNMHKAEKSACIIAICMQRDPEDRLPEWEELAATSCAVQNLWLTAAAYGIGTYWSSPKAIEALGPFLDLNQGERCIGLMYMGYSAAACSPGKRSPIEDKVRFFD